MGDMGLPPGLRRRTDREAIFEDIEPYLGTTVEERSSIMSSLCHLAAEQIAARPDGWRVLTHQAPRSRESEQLWLRLVSASRRS